MGLFDRLANLARGKATTATPTPPTPSAPATAATPRAGEAREDPLALIAAGQALEEQGRAREALALYDRALTLSPTLAKAHLNRGNALLALGELEAAVHAYEAAAAHDPAAASGPYNLGNALAQAGRPQEALAAYGRALERDPGFADAEVAMALVHEDLGNRDEAAAHYRSALRLQPGYAPVHGNLAAVLLAQAKFEEAAASYRRALELDPQLVPLHAGLAQALLALGRSDEAVASLKRALAVMPTAAPGAAPLQHALGVALTTLGRHDEAAASFRRVLAIDAKHLDAACLLGNRLADEGRLHEALACYERMLQADPKNVLAHNNIGGVLRRLGHLDEAAASYERALAIDPGLLAARSNLLFIRHSRAGRPSEALLAEARRYGEAAARAARPFTQWSNAPLPDKPLRVGLVSGDLRSHPVGHFLVGALAALEQRAGARIELAAYHNHPAFDDVSARIRASCRLWRDVSALGDEALAEQVRADGIDILIDLAGHTGHTRLPVFAWKPAPVQASWLGYLATTGVAAIDYVIADALALPPVEEAFFTETVWRLPQSYLCFTPPGEAGEVGPLPALASGASGAGGAGGAGGPITFGSFNNLAKVTDDVVALWSRVLVAVPGSRLLLKAQQLQEAAQREALAERFARHGIERGRLLLEGLVPRADYLKPFARLDIALDPFPYPGITTTVESLWMGVPVLTLAGHTFFARQGAALLAHAGLPDWIATDEGDYVARAVRHAADLAALAALRARLRSQVLASPLFDAPRFAGHLQEALRAMWQRWCAKG